MKKKPVKNWSRRAFMKETGAMAVFALTLGGIPNFVLSAAKKGRTSLKQKKLICIFQRGAMDGLAAVQPYDDAYLKQLRPDLMLKTGPDGLSELDGRFGLHPRLKPLMEFYRDGRLAIVHGIGSPVPNRSHFDAQDFMETGTPGVKGTRSGWLNRAIGLLGHESTPFQAVSITPALPRSLYGDHYCLTVENLEDIRIGNDDATDTSQLSFEQLYAKTTSEILKGSGSNSFEAANILAEKGLGNYGPRKGVNYPVSPLGNGLKQLAQLIKMDVGLEIGFAESAGWDTHARQAGRFGVFNRQAQDLSSSISAFWNDIEPFQDDVVVMTMTEFGRTVHQNGSLGTDHGRGSCMFVLGNHADGGKVYGEVPELVRENLEDERDLPVTTDFRSLFQSIIQNQLGFSSSEGVFPGWNGPVLEIFNR